MTPVAPDRADDRQDLRPVACAAADHSASPVVLERRGPDAARRLRGCFADDPQGRNRRTDRPARRRPHRTGAVDLRHAAARSRQRSRSTAQPLELRSNRDAIRAGIGYLSEDRLSLGLIQPQSIADNTGDPGARQDPRAGGLISYAQEGRAGRRAGSSDLAIKIGRPTDAVSTLSGGNQQRVAIAKWLAVGPEADHPRLPHRRRRCRRAGRDLRDRRSDLADEGLAILLISDEVPEVYFNADRVLHMAAGRIVGEYDPRRIALTDARGGGLCLARRPKAAARSTRPRRGW